MMPNATPSRARLWVEGHLGVFPIYVAGAVTAGAMLWSHISDGQLRGLQEVLGPDAVMILATISTLAGSLLGFILASISVLLVITASPRLGRVTSSSAYKHLWRLFFAATVSLGLLTILTLTLMVVASPARPLTALLSWSVLFVAVDAAVRVGVCIWILATLVAIQLDGGAGDGSDRTQGG